MPFCSEAGGMVMPGKKKKKYPGPCPDPEKYILVQTKKGAFWRRKRGTVRPAHLNDSFKRNVANSKVAAPAAKRVIRALQHWLRDLHTGRLQVRMTTAFIKSINKKGCIDFSCLEDFEFHEYKLRSLLHGGCFVKQNGKAISISIHLNEYTMNQHSRLVIGYSFEAILLYGDVTKDKGFEVDSVVSPLYAFHDTTERQCELTLYLPDESVRWMVMLKVSCQEENRMATHPKGYGMRVVG